MKMPFFKIGEAWDDFKLQKEYGTGVDKVSSAAKLVGKSVANIGMFGIEMGTEVIKKMPEIVAAEKARQGK